MKKSRVLLIMVLLVALCSVGARGAGGIMPGSVLVVDLGGDIPETVAFNPLMSLLGSDDQPVVLDKLLLLDTAAKDPRIKAVIIRITSADYGLAKAQEFRDAIIKFQEKSGKPIDAYLELEGGGNLEYYLASAADHVYMSPASSLGLIGLHAFRFYLGGVWDKIYVDLQVDRIKEYKSFADMLERKDMSDAEREVTNAILDSSYSQFVSGIAQGRGVSEDTVKGWIDAAFMTSSELREAKVVDGVAYLDEVAAKLGADRSGKIAWEKDYARTAGERYFSFRAHKVAVVYGVGNIISGEEPKGPFAPSNIIASEAMVRRLEKAMNDDSIDAVIFRIDSGGGSALASDVIWRATQRLKAKKPLVVSMSDVAGSGGYYIACGADAIVAQPGTITGSIGILTARPSVGRLLDKIGVGTASVKRGEFADMDRFDRKANEAELMKIHQGISSLYDLFITRVGAGRGLSKERVNEIGRGRVWTGAQAQDIGLVTRLGGFDAAIAEVKSRLGLPADAEVELEYKHERVSFWKLITGRVEEQVWNGFVTPEERELIMALRVRGLYRPGQPLAIMAGPVEIR